MALNATAASATANSYITVADADTYFSEYRLHSEDWTSIDVGDITTKPRALMEATLLIDRAFSFAGTRRTADQALRWPRAGAIDEDGYSITYDAIPEIVKRATCELAIVLIASDPFQGSEIDRELGRVVTAATIGPLKVDLDPGRAIAAIPERVRLMLAAVGEPLAGISSGGNSLSQIKTGRS